MDGETTGSCRIESKLAITTLLAIYITQLSEIAAKRGKIGQFRSNSP